MAKQEEIIEGVAERLAQFGGYDWAGLSSEAKGTYRGRAIVLACYLLSQDVVLKVKKDLPEPSVKVRGNYLLGYYTCRLDFLHAGCGFFEPLIKEVSNGEEVKS